MKIRGRRESREPVAPAASRAKCRKHTSSSPQVHRDTRPSLRNGFNGFLRALPGDRALLPPSLARIAPRNLTPTSGRQDHTTSPSASVPFVSDTAPSTASRPASVTIAIRPSEGWDLLGVLLFLPIREAEYFWRWGWTHNCERRPSGKSPEA